LIKGGKLKVKGIEDFVINRKGAKHTDSKNCEKPKP